MIYLRWWFDTERVCAACNACTFRTIMRSARAFIQRPRRLPGRTRACANVRACMCDMLRDRERSELVSTYNSYYDCWRERDHACESASTVRRLDKSNSQTVQNYLNVLRVRREQRTVLQQSATCATFYARRHTHTLTLHAKTNRIVHTFSVYTMYGALCEACYARRQQHTQTAQVLMQCKHGDRTNISAYPKLYDFMCFLKSILHSSLTTYANPTKSPDGQWDNLAIFCEFIFHR